MFVEPSYEDILYSKNLRTGETWVEKPVEKYGVFNLITGGRHSEYDQITRNPRIDLLPDRNVWNRGNGNELPLKLVHASDQ